MSVPDGGSVSSLPCHAPQPCSRGWDVGLSKSSLPLSASDRFWHAQKSSLQGPGEPVTRVHLLVHSPLSLSAWARVRGWPRRLGGLSSTAPSRKPTLPSDGHCRARGIHESAIG